MVKASQYSYLYLYTILYYILYCTVLYSTLLYSTVLYYTILYYTNNKLEDQSSHIVWLEKVITAQINQSLKKE